MFDGIREKIKSFRQKEEWELPLDPVSVMTRELNQYPMGTRRQFTIDFGPGIRQETVTAYIDPEEYQRSGGNFTSLRIEDLPEELHKFI